MEGAPKTPEQERNESTEQPFHQIEEVVAHSQEIRSECLHDPHSPACSIERLHAEIEHSDIREVFASYENHRILSISDITASIEKVTAHLESELATLPSEDEEYQFAFEKYNLIRTRANEIRTSVGRYVRTLSQFFQLTKQRFRLEPEDFRDKLQAIDRQRRTSHDALIETLSIYSRLVTELKNYGFLENYSVIVWDQTTVLSEAESESQLLIFDNKVLANRDLVKDWAISAHLHEQLEHIKELKENGSAERSQENDPTV